VFTAVKLAISNGCSTSLPGCRAMHRQASVWLNSDSTQLQNAIILQLVTAVTTAEE